MTDEAADRALMRLALAEAERGVGFTSPNPAVGAVIVRDGAVIATGYHRRAGTDHAEVAALRTLGFRAAGATLYSTLEPCNHQGRTGPCTEAIIAAGLTRVVVGAIDPNPRVRGEGLARLRAAGIAVHSGVEAATCEALNEPFNFAIQHRRPFVTLKAAISLDGRIATRGGESRWITGEAARAAGRALRARLDGIVVGIGTVLADDPALTSRRPGAHDPVRFVLDRALRLPLESQLVKTAGQTPTYVVTGPEPEPARRAALEAEGVHVLSVGADAQGRPRLEDFLGATHDLGLNGLLVEGGATLLGTFVEERRFQKLELFMAPTVLGVGGRAVFACAGPEGLAEAPKLRIDAVQRLGADLQLSAYLEG